MTRKTKKTEGEKTQAAVTSGTWSGPLEETSQEPPRTQVPKSSASVRKRDPVMNFDRWFATTGRPAHHKAGMRAFLGPRRVNGKKTVAEWERLFRTY